MHCLADFGLERSQLGHSVHRANGIQATFMQYLCAVMLETNSIEMARRGVTHAAPIDNHIIRHGDGPDSSEPRDPVIRLRGVRRRPACECHKRGDADADRCKP
jgi:hypothetical protein